MLQISNLTKRYKRNVALDDVTFALGKGVCGLVGENGAGKSTIMKILTRQIRQDKGSIVYEGEAWSDRHKAKVGYLPQQFDFFRNLTVWESMVYLLHVRGIAIADEKGQIAKWLDYLNLSGEAGKKIKELSGGMKQRLGIAQAFLGEPDIILLDEPTVGLDPQERLAFRNMVNEVGDNKTVLISTHILDDVESACERMVSLQGGKVMYAGSVAGFIKADKKLVYSLRIPRGELAGIGDEISIISIKRDGEELAIRFSVNNGEACRSKAPYRNGSLKKEKKSLEDAYIHHTSYSFRRQDNGR
ncbi:MAG: ATP-binding cassette domain-containing protein [Lachnospiraceae bacterium]|jgi:ABC-2 type transport system ATP-binding protein|nr:ATP-binding cassette domain-containing protein [Lachnospiraceae bacterium]